MYRAAHKLLCSHRTTPFIPILKQSELLYSPVYPHPSLVNHYATDPNRRPGFFESLLDNLKQEYSKSKEMKESLEKFREEAKKLEESDALKEARRKFMNIEGETAKSKNVFRKVQSDNSTDLSENTFTFTQILEILNNQIIFMKFKIELYAGIR